MDTLELDELEDVLLDTLVVIDVDEVVVVGVDTLELDEVEGELLTLVLDEVEVELLTHLKSMKLKLNSMSLTYCKWRKVSKKRKVRLTCKAPSGFTSVLTWSRHDLPIMLKHLKESNNVFVCQGTFKVTVNKTGPL